MTTVIEQNQLKNLAYSLKEEERRLEKQFKMTEQVNKKHQDLEEEIHRLRLEIIKEDHLKEKAEQTYHDFQNQLDTKQKELTELQTALTLTNTAKKIAHQEAEIQISCLKKQLNDVIREKQEKEKQIKLEKDRQEAKKNRKFGPGQQGTEKPPKQYKIYSSSGGFGPKFQPSKQYKAQVPQPVVQNHPADYQQFQY